MPIPSGRAYSAPGNGRELQALRDEIAQLRRRMTNPPKIPPPVVAGGGGGVIGQAEFYAKAGTVGSTDGATGMEYWKVQWDDPYDPSELSDPTWARINGHQIALDPGSYIATIDVRLHWASEAGAPDKFDVVLRGGNDVAHLDFCTFPRVRIGATTFGLSTIYSPGAFRATRPVEFEVQYAGSAAATVDGSAVLLVTRIA